MAAHARRRRTFGANGLLLPRVRAGGILAMAASVAVVAAVVVFAASLGGHARVRGTTSSTVPSGSWGRPVIVLRGLRSPQAYSTGACLYVAVQISRPGAVVRSALLRVDPASGRILARRRLGGQFDHMLLANGRLWVTVAGPGDITLSGLDEATLRPLSSTTFYPTGADSSLAGGLAVAGGWLWVGSEGAIARVSLITGTLSEFVTVRPAGPVGVAADAPAKTLLVVAGRERSYIQRRDPATGALIETSGRFDGVLQPALSGVAGGRTWLSQATGMAGYVERIDARHIASARQPDSFGSQTPTLIFGSNGMRAQVIAGILYVTQVAGGRQRNYCADPVTGRPRAALPFRNYSELLTADTGFLYYVPNFSNPYSASIARVPIDPRCR